MVDIDSDKELDEVNFSDQEFTGLIIKRETQTGVGQSSQKRTRDTGVLTNINVATAKSAYKDAAATT